MKQAFIFGVANSGKTTLFNGLTGKNERTGNWFGVTTEAKAGFYKSDSGEKIIVYDLPGSYLDEYTLEGKVASNVLNKQINESAAVVLCEAINLEKGLKLLKSVKKHTNNAALVINFYGELLRYGGKIDLKRLKAEVECDVIIAEANEKSGVNAVKKLLNKIFAQIDFEKNKNDKKNIDGKSPLFCKTYEINETEITKKTLVIPKIKLSRADKIILNKPLLSLTAFAFIFFAAVYLSFGEYGVGKLFSKVFDFAISAVIETPTRRLLKLCGASPFITAFVCDGAIGSVCALITFLPPLIVLQAFICLAEESGILARAAFVFDDVFSFAGLSGRAVFTFLTGYGCTAAAAICADGLENSKLKRRATLALPFIPCSAKTPVFLYILSLIGGRFAFFAIAVLYVLGLFAAFLFAFFNKKLKKEKKQELIVEFPPYRLPKTKTTLKSLQKFTKSFIIKIGLTVFTVTMCFWLAGAITSDFAFTQNINDSVLCLMGKKFAFVFAPIGVKDWRLSLAAVAGIFAKEGVASVLIACGGANVTDAQFISYLVFFALYSPCLAALAAIKKSVGLKYALHAFFCQNFIALIACYVTYYIIIAFCSLKIVLTVALAVVTFLSIILFATRKKFALRKKRKKLNFKNPFAANK